MGPVCPTYGVDSCVSTDGPHLVVEDEGCGHENVVIVVVDHQIYSDPMRLYRGSCRLGC